MTLENLWTSLADMTARSGMTCGRSADCHAECCHPAFTGGEPGVTPPEIALINSFLAKHKGFRFYEAGASACKFLGKNGKCRIYAVRPIDCRVHFCKENSMASQSNCRLTNLVQDYHAQNESLFLATELIDSYRFSGED